jgi:hypothetical protein
MSEPRAAAWRNAGWVLGWILVWAILAGRAFGSVPIWDGWQFLHECQLDFAAEPGLRCYGHSAAVYTVLFGGLQKLFGPSPWVSSLVSFALALVAVATVYRLLAHAFGERLPPFARATLSALWLLNPIATSQIVDPGLDLLLAVLAARLFLALVERRWFTAALLGMALEFTKETGVMLYGILTGLAVLDLLVRHLRARPRPKVDRRAVIVRGAALLSPLILFGLYMRAFPPHHDAGGSWGAVVGEILTASPWTPFVRNQAVSLFVVSFSWVLTLLAGVGALRWLRRGEARPAEQARVLSLAWAALVACFVIQTRVSAFGNPRYVLPLFVFLLLVAADGVLSLGARGSRPVSAGVAVLFLASLWWTVDPISRWLQGTVSFGGRSMLVMSHAPKDTGCCGAGRDQLVYNLQFLKIGDLSERAVQRFGVEADYVLPAKLTWFHYSDLKTFRDRSSPYRSVIPVKGAFPVRMQSLRGLRQSGPPPAQVIYLAYPTAPTGADLRTLRQFYPHEVTTSVTDGAYVLPVHLFSRAPIQLPEAERTMREN